MEIGIIGLGKMGGNIARRLMRAGWRVVGLDHDPALLAALDSEGLVAAESLPTLIAQLTAPRTIWVMVPAGPPTDAVLTELSECLEPKDILIEGGNSNYKQTMQRAAMLSERGIHMVDVGTSGGIWGLAEGYSMMIGGEEAVVQQLTPLFEALAPAPDLGWGHVGPNGAGHFVKMIHNGIEYGMMQAFAEGFAILDAKKEFDLDLHQVAQVWQHGSVVRSWLLDLTADLLDQDVHLSSIAPFVQDSGEGRWTVEEALDLDIPAPVITLSLLQRFRSRINDSYADKLLAGMRKQFGGHAIKPSEHSK